MSYTHRLTIATPVAMIDSANTIARSMDPDVGGAESFGTVRATDTTEREFAVCDVWVREIFAFQASAILKNSTLLHEACTADYTNRWPSLLAPTLVDCSSFINQSLISIRERSNEGVEDVLQSMGLTLISTEPTSTP